MILLADSGSTKTTWALIDKQRTVASGYTQGFSPSFQSAETMSSIMREELQSDILALQNQENLQVFFYGTGCSTPGKISLMQCALADIFLNASITVNHDLYAAAIALCGNTEGIACILGTGSNSCHFDGHSIQENFLSLGYFFGDQGSGAHMGKTLLQYYLEDRLPQPLQVQFSGLDFFNKEYILEQVYKKPMPQRFLASYSRILAENMGDPFIQKLIKQCFTEFFIHQVEKYSVHNKTAIHFVGSIAVHFKTLLIEVMEERNLKLGKIIQDPMEGLIAYHGKQ